MQIRERGGAEMHDWHGRKPDSLAGYLEAMSFAIFTAGINWKVVDSKWEGIREAFSGFDVEIVAAMTPADVDRLSEDRRVIRNRRKIEGIVDNAARMLELDKGPGGFAGYLRSHADFAATVADLKRNFRFLGDTSAYFFLAAVDEPVPKIEEGAFTQHRAHKA
jgi:DNA-3-methyladenine glycosylase I